MSFITIKSFDSYIDAHLLKSKLESEGVDSFLFDEQTVTMMPVYTWAIGGIKLKVRESDLEATKIVLRELKNTPFQDDEGNSICCPKCGSKDVNNGYGAPEGIKGLFLALLGFISMTFAPLKGSKYYCINCKNGFRS